MAYWCAPRAAPTSSAATDVRVRARARASACGSSSVAAIGAWSKTRRAAPAASSPHAAIGVSRNPSRTTTARAGGNVDRVEAECRELGHQRARHAAGALVGAETRPQAVVGEAARRLLDQALLLAQREAEHAPSFAPPGLRTQGVVEPRAWSS